jgi:hypothetical protein
MPKHTAEAGIVAGLLLILADVMVPEMKPSILAAGLFLIGTLFIGGAFDVWLRPSAASAQSPPTSTGKPQVGAPGMTQSAQNITSYGQQGGITGIVNIGPQRLVFSSELGSELLARMPRKKKVNITSVGGVADQAVAIDIQNFLQQNGYEVSRISVGMLLPPPDHKISLGDSPDGYVLTIAPSAN